MYLNRRKDLIFSGINASGKACLSGTYRRQSCKKCSFSAFSEIWNPYLYIFSLQVRETTMVPSVHLKEFQDKFLQIGPKFFYDDLLIDMHDTGDHYFQEDSGKQLLIRNVPEEEAFIEYIRSMHPQFKTQSFQPYFLLSFDEVMKNQWFIQFSKQLMAEDIKMIGFNELKRFKYNTSTPNGYESIQWYRLV